MSKVRFYSLNQLRNCHSDIHSKKFCELDGQRPSDKLELLIGYFSVDSLDFNKAV